MKITVNFTVHIYAEETKGWNGKKLWVPNIKLPSNTMYYDVIEEDA